jgi:GNAT superfamily N-acetyltransferase
MVPKVSWLQLFSEWARLLLRISKSPAMCEIRFATQTDIPLLPAIEHAAATWFGQYPESAALPEDETPLGALYEAQQAGRLWVAAPPGQAPVAFALVKLLDGVAHLEEMDVLPQFGRQGLGTKLVQTVCAWARDCGLAAVTLTTFRTIPWNAPFYRRLGFQELAPEELTTGLRRLVAEEERRGLPRELRVVMRYRTGRDG